MGFLGRIIYWLVVLAISVALLILLVHFFEARDDSDVGTRAVGASTAGYSTFGGCRPTSRANVTMRCAAEYSGWQALSTSRS